VSLTTRAALFNTHCSLSVVVFGATERTALQWSTSDVMKAWTTVTAESASSERQMHLSWRRW